MAEIYKRGSKGDAVKQIQRALGVRADGVFGIGTESAVIKFQKENGLYADGIVGKKTLALLNINFDTDVSANIITSSSLEIIDYLLPKSEYLNGKYTNDYIVLHHTAGAANPKTSIDSWAKDSLGRVATEFVVGGQDCRTGSTLYDGKIYRAFPEGNQASHIGASGSAYMNLHSVGIEMCNFGYVKNGKTYIGTQVLPDQIVSLNTTFRGYSNWHKYSDEQLKSVRELLLYIANRDNIDLHKGLYYWIKSEGPMKAFDFHQDAYDGKIKGLLTHTNIRKDKFDCSPQPNLVDMILSL